MRNTANSILINRYKNHIHKYEKRTPKGFLKGVYEEKSILLLVINSISFYN